MVKYELWLVWHPGATECCVMAKDNIFEHFSQKFTAFNTVFILYYIASIGPSGVGHPFLVVEPTGNFFVVLTPLGDIPTGPGTSGEARDRGKGPAAQQPSSLESPLYFGEFTILSEIVCEEIL